MAERQTISDRQLAVAITLSAAALAITIASPAWQPGDQGQASRGMEPGGAGAQPLIGTLVAPGGVGSTGRTPERRDEGQLAPRADGPGNALDRAPAAGGLRLSVAPLGSAADEAPRRPLVPLVPRQLLPPGCCADAWWSTDSRELRFIDQRADTGTTAVFGVPVWPPGSPTQAADIGPHMMVAGRYAVRHHADHAEIQDLATGEVWTLPTGGAPFLVAPDGHRVVWWATRGDREAVNQLVPIYGSDIEGRSPRRLLDLWGAAVVSFHPDSRRVLVAGRTARETPRQTLLLLDTVTGAVEVLATAAFLDGATLSTNGEWVAYMVSLDREHPEANGVWVTSTQTGERRKLPFDGAYRWRDGRSLVCIAMSLSSEWHDVWQFDAPTGEMKRLIDGRSVSLRVANNDWTISPDGNTMAFVAAQDRGVWVIDLPPR